MVYRTENLVLYSLIYQFLSQLKEICRVELDEFACITRELKTRVQNVTEKGPLLYGLIKPVT